MDSIRLIAFYLPQFHPIPENDNWWGKGFTEWVNVAKARPLFKKHYQPHIPADLGFYDLRMPEIRKEQAEMAKQAGIEGFCYWHYWFGNGKRLLELPFNEVLRMGEPDYPFCLCWANHTWSNKTWQKTGRSTSSCILMKQEYLGDEDYTAHFYALLPAFKDPRYMTVDGCPIFMVYDPDALPDMKHFIELWRSLAVKNGLKGIHFVGRTNNASYTEVGQRGTHNYALPRTDNASVFYQAIRDYGFDAVNSVGRMRAEIMCKGVVNHVVKRILSKYLKIDILDTFSQEKINKHLITTEDYAEDVYPTIFPNWDRSPRAGKRATIYTDSTPQAFKNILEKAIESTNNKQSQHKIVFIQAWNEWGEGNHLEPDLKYGTGYLDVIRDLIHF